MRFPPFRQSWHQPSTGKGVRTCDSQPFLTDAWRSRRDRTGECVETTSDYWKQSFAGRCECNGPRTSTKERLTANVLEYADLVADRGRRHAELIGRLSEAHMPRSGLEGAK
jgi:hypothetical protein